MVRFRLQSGRMLEREDLTAKDVSGIVMSSAVLAGVDRHWPEIEMFYANTRHIVEWWDWNPKAGSP